MNVRRIGVWVLGAMLLVLIGNQSLDIVGSGLGKEKQHQYEEVNVDGVILKGLDTEGLTGLYDFVEEYPDLQKITLGKDLKGMKNEFKDKYSTNLAIKEEDKLCNYYYKEGYNLKYCSGSGLEDVSIKLDKNKIKDLYQKDLSIATPVTETKVLEYRGAKFNVKYVLDGENKYLMDLNIKIN